LAESARPALILLSRHTKNGVPLDHEKSIRCIIEMLSIKSVSAGAI
jgi:hypothetical protein